jgi:dihydroxyacid dehydratase/phosphogluconate dehydratase
MHRVSSDIPVLANVQPAGEFLGEDFFHAGGIPAIMHDLLVLQFPFCW